MRRIRIDLALVLPEIPDLRDACVGRIELALRDKLGIKEAHVVGAKDAKEALLCLHYDPAIVSLTEVEREALAAGAQVSQRYGHAVLPIRSIGSQDIGRRIEALILSEPGVVATSFNLPAQRLRVEFERATTSAEAITARLRRLGHLGEEVGAPRADPAGAPWYRRHRELATSLLAGVCVLGAWRGAPALPSGVTMTLYALAYLLGGYDIVRHLWASLRKGQFTFDIELLMILAALGAAALGEFAEGGFLLFLFGLAHALEHYALDRARGAIRALSDLSPAMARVQRGTTFEVPVEQVRRGEIVVVRPGERVPVDGRVERGHSVVNQAPITGESVPVEKQVGDDVFAGTINGEGVLSVATTRAVGDRTLDRVVRLVEEAQTQKAPTQEFTDRFESIFVPVIIAAVLLIAVGSPLFGLWSWEESFSRGMAVLVAASPCALALGTPSAVLAGIAQAARHGVLIKGGAHLETLGGVSAIAFDKTGTLTVGEPRVTGVVPFTGSADELLTLAAAVERDSQHPLARAVVREAVERKLSVAVAVGVQSVTGKGIRGRVSGQMVELGSLRLWEAGIVPQPIGDVVDRLQREGNATMVVRAGEHWLGAIGLADTPRPEAREVIERLNSMGVREIAMLTGDNKGIASLVGTEIGIVNVHADLMPEDKIRVLQDLAGRHAHVAMVGDGVNDAPALARASVGIAMGGAGTAVALETADVALMANDLSRLPFAIELARSTRRIIRQNLLVSLGIVAALIMGTVSGMAGIASAVAIHEGSTLVVIANALRLLRRRPQAPVTSVASA